MKSLLDYIKESAEQQPNAFVILKPGFLNHKDEWMSQLTDNNWDVIDQRQMRLTHDQACELYSMHKDKDFYNDLCDYMCSDDCLCCICHRKCTDPIKDMDKFKDNIRKSWGKDDMRNAMHSSDSLDNVKREKKIVFG